MIVSLSFIVSASPPVPKPKTKPFNFSSMKFKGKKIHIKEVPKRGRGKRKPITYQSPTVITIKEPIRKDLTAPKTPTFSPEPEKGFDSMIEDITNENSLQHSIFRNPILDFFGPSSEEKSKISYTFPKEIAEWIHSAEVYHTLLELLEAIFEIGSDSDSDSSDDSDEDGYTYSDTIVVDSTKAVQVVLYLKPINLQQ